MSFPIFFIHMGTSYYLKYALAQARSWNLNSMIHLVSDVFVRGIKGVEQHNIKGYATNAEGFERLYEHLSRHSEAFELFCFKRWFILEEFITSNKIDTPFFYLDSDVMLYEDLGTLSWLLGQFDFTVTIQRGPQYLFFKHGDVLRDFTAFIRGIYADDRSRRDLARSYHEYCSGPSFVGGGVCDMTLLNMYRNRTSYTCFDLNTIVNDSIFDNSICSRNQFEFDEKRGIKRLYWSNSIPYGFHTELKKLIKFNALHFQGEGKKYIPFYYRGNVLFPQVFYENYLLINLARRIKRIALEFMKH